MHTHTYTFIHIMHAYAYEVATISRLGYTQCDIHIPMYTAFLGIIYLCMQYAYVSSNIDMFQIHIVDIGSTHINV